jgi:DNA-binding NarL/FixJ family response regulator
MKTILCYVKDESGRYLSVNNAFLHCIQAGGLTDVIGLTDQEISWGYPVSSVIENDHLVLTSGQRQIFFETCLYNGVKQLFRSTKTPMINTVTHQKMIHGVSIPVSDTCLVFLSTQQSTCLQYFALGFTHKQIGELLEISQKTVEHYLEAVKLKLGCKARSALVMHAVERGLIEA